MSDLDEIQGITLTIYHKSAHIIRSNLEEIFASPKGTLSTSQLRFIKCLVGMKVPPNMTL